MPPGFVGDKTYAEVGAPLAHCFDEAVWSENQLVARTDSGGDLRDPLCGPPRAWRSDLYCTDD